MSVLILASRYFLWLLSVLNIKKVYFEFRTPIDCDPIGIVEMLYNTNVVAVVGKNEKGEFSQCRLSIWDTVSESIKTGFTYSSPIEFVKMNKHW